MGTAAGANVGDGWKTGSVRTERAKGKDRLLHGYTEKAHDNFRHAEIARKKAASRNRSMKNNPGKKTMTGVQALIASRKKKRLSDKRHGKRRLLDNNHSPTFIDLVLLMQSHGILDADCKAVTD